MTRRRAIFFVACAVVAAPLAGCSSSHEPGRGQARLQVDGVVDVAKPAESWRRGGDGLLDAGTRVRVRQGTALLTFPGDATVELRPDSVVRVGTSAGLLAGDALVSSPRPFTVDAETAAVRVDDGAARVGRSLAVEAAVYRGRATLSSTDRRLVVPALRQAVVAAPGLVPVRPTPLVYRGTDSWDRRFLAEWMAVGEDLEARSRGLTAQVGTTPRPAPFFRGLLPALGRERTFTAGLVAGGPPQPGEKLVGAAVALVGQRGTFESRWASVFAFRADGAAWGLVALDQLDDQSRSPLLRTLEAALAAFSRSSSGVFGGGGGPLGASPVPRSAPGRPGPGATSAPPTTRPRQTSPPTTAPPNSGPVPPPPQTGVAPVDGTSQAMVDIVNGLLKPPGG
jgi:hypothetical protein